VVGESFLAALVYLFLRHDAPVVAPRPGLTPRIAVAALPAFAIVALPVSWLVTLPVALVVFVGVSLALHAIPPELNHALRRR
jgi:hypothetical protein